MMSGTVQRKTLPILTVIVLVSITVVLVTRELAGRQSVTVAIVEPSGLEVNALFAQVRSFDVAMNAPRGIAITPSGNIVICGSGAVEIRSAAGALVAEYSVDGEIECAAVDMNGTIYLGTGDHVTVLEPASGLVTEWTDLDEESIITSITVSGEHVFVADSGKRRVWVFDRHGMLTNIIDGFIIPSPYFDVAPGAEGKVWVVDPGRHSISLYDAEGKKSVSFGRYSTAIDGFGGCCNPTNIAARPDGTIIAVEKGTMKLKLFSNDGEFQGFVAGPRDFSVYDAEIDIAVAPGGELLILSPRVGQVMVFEKERGEE